MDQNPPKESRPPINLRIKFRSESVEQFIERYAVDVSRGGIFIRTREPLAVGTQLKLDFQFQNGTALMAGDGTVVWIREFDANRTNVPPGMGVRFDKLTPESQAVLEQLLIEKAKREKSGVPGSASHGAGGIAVRRPSSMFSVLEPQAAAKASADARADAAANRVQEGPLGPLATVTAQASSALKPATGTGGDETKKYEASPYRPLGKARNPFSSVGTPAETAKAAGRGGPWPAPGAGPAAAAKGSRDSADDSAEKSGRPSDDSAPFDDISDEPTQIAGRLPSFLLSDDDATVANAQVPRDGAENQPAAATGRNPLPGMARVDTPGRAKQPTLSRDEGRQLPDQNPSTPREPGSAGTAAEDGAAAAAEDPAQQAAAAAADNDGDAAAVATTAAAAGPSPPSRAVIAGSEKRRPAAAWIAVGVLVLGAAGIFLFRFFGSQSTQSGPALTTGVATVSPPPAAAAGEAQPPPTPPTLAAPEHAAAPAAPDTVAAAQPAKPEAMAPPENAVPVGSEPGAVPVVPSTESVIHKPAKRKPTHALPRDTATADAAGATPTTAAAEAKPTSAGTAAGAPGGTAAEAPKPPEQGGVATEGEPPVHQVRVTSKPDGADVTLDGQTVGKTPYTVEVPDVSAPHLIAVHKEGFEPFEQTVTGTSPWSKPKVVTKGKPPLQLLKVNAKLKAVAGAEVRPATQPEPAAGVDTASKVQPPTSPAKLAAPAEERPATEPAP